MSRNSSFLVSNPSNQNSFSQTPVDGEFFKSKELMGSDYFQNQNHHTSGLARYRSAPSSFLETLLDDNNSSSGDEAEAFFSSLIDGPMKQETEVGLEARPEFQNGYDNAFGSYDSRNGSNLVRQSSSPAEFFNGFGIMGEVGNYRVQNQSEVGSTTRFMPSIPENVNESVATANGDGASSQKYEPAFPHESWNDSTFNNLKRTRSGDPKMFSDFSGDDNLNGEAVKRTSSLVSHMSLPKTSAEMAMVENYLHFQPEKTVPCQFRAKRGFATHPRSIAERMRRTRISKNIKRLQDLFPDMDKQMNTAEMLDLAVDYIKNLQKEVEKLKESKDNCVCPSKSQ